MVLSLYVLTNRFFHDKVKGEPEKSNLCQTDGFGSGFSFFSPFTPFPLSLPFSGGNVEPEERQEGWGYEGKRESKQEKNPGLVWFGFFVPHTGKFQKQKFH